MKNKEKYEARKLRESGMSIRNIATQLNVSKGSVSLWVKDIILTQKQIETLKKSNNIYECQVKGAAVRKKNAYQERLQHQELGKLKAKEDNLLHMAGCMLYWGEGAKSKSSCRFSNADPNMLKMFIRFLNECYQINNNQIKIHVICYTGNGLSVQDIEQYWSKELDIDMNQFDKTTVNNVSVASKKKKPSNILLYGTIHIKVYDYRIVQSIYGAIQEYAKFSSEYCVNGY